MWLSTVIRKSGLVSRKLEIVYFTLSFVSGLMSWLLLRYWQIHLARLLDGCMTTCWRALFKLGTTRNQFCCTCHETPTCGATLLRKSIWIIELGISLILPFQRDWFVETMVMVQWRNLSLGR